VTAGVLVEIGRVAIAQAPKPVSNMSTSADRKDVGITVYNDGFGLVREVRDVNLGTGRTALEFRDVAALIEPETVAIKPLGGARVNVLEQNYRFDLLTPQKLLEKYVGRRVRLYRYSEKLGKEDTFDADVLSVAGGQSVLKVNGEITYDFPGRIAFPDVPANLIAKPTLVWLLDSAAAKPTVEVTYLTKGLDWHCDYVFVLNDADTAGDLTAWVTLANTSGAGYENAKLKLVAGNVQRVAPAHRKMMSMEVPAAVPPPPPQFKEEGFFEYHLYTLNQPTTLLENETKQVTLLDATGVHVDKRLIFWGQQYWYRSQQGQVLSNQKVGVYLDIQNRDNNHLGIALPKGVVRVYKADKSGAKQFIGEDNIDHTPRDEKLRIKMGEAFDVVGDRKQTSWKTLGTCGSESEWEIALRNHKDTVEEVEDVEPVAGDWEVVSESHPHTKKDATTFTYTVKVPARGELKIRYKVRVRWC
jgi:hypothetical protein